MNGAWPISWGLYAIVAATAAPLAFFIGAELLRAGRDAQIRAEQLVLSMATTAASNTRMRLWEAEFFAGAVARRPMVRALDPAHCDPLIRDLLPLLPHYANISVLDRQRRFICSAVPMNAKGQILPEHAGITGALAGRFALSEPLMGVLPVRLVVSAGYPVIGENGEVIGAVTIPIDLASLQPASDPLALPQAARVRVIDSRGVLVASSIRNDPQLGKNLKGAEIVDHVLARGSGTVRARGTDGVDRVYGFMPVGAQGWHAYAGVPATELFAAARRRVIEGGTIAGALLVMALLAAGLVARAVSRPAAAIQEAMDEAAAGHGTRAIAAGPRELRSLAENYNRMLDAREHAQEASRESEARLKLAVRASHTGLWDWDLATGNVYLSPEWKRQLGYDDDEVRGSVEQWSDRLHPDDRDRVLAEQHRVIDSGETGYEAEFRLRHRDGQYRWIYSRAEVLRNAAGAPLRMLGTHIDVTARKHMEQALQQTVSELRVLSIRLIEVEEAERRSISRELHDRTGANVAALHITLGLLADKLADRNIGAAASLVADARQVLTQTSSEIRNIMAELRPSALDDFGLYPALLGYAKGVALRLGIALDATGGAIEPRPASAVETALFRIAQEALTNAAKHAHATRLGIDLHEKDGVLVLAISDDGAGFDTAHATRSHRHGMRTMRERAEAIRAKLTVRSARGSGTCVTVEAPRA